MRLLRRLRLRALLTGEPIALSAEPPPRRHIAGAAIFGLGRALTDACPARPAGQLAQGMAWSLFTAAGVVLGVYAYLRREERRVRATTRPPEQAAVAPAR